MRGEGRVSRLLRSPIENRLQAWHGEIWHTTRGRIIRDIVYAVDTGLVTTVSFIAGISVSVITAERIVLAGLIQIASGMLAIFFGSYMSTKAQKSFFENQIERERREIQENPQKETDEIRAIFNEMGFTREEQEIAVRHITSDRELWLEFMIQEEIGVSPGLIDNPYEIGVISAASFLVGALPAITPFFLFGTVSEALMISAISVLTFLFILGLLKTRITKAHWLASALETMLIGAISSGTGFLFGRIIAGYF
ncbi:MAG: VIT1/CCC1 transporter family protein [Candidatus Bathyarchaeia archaeon]